MMITYDFNTIINRRGTNCAKYDLFDEDVLPLWVADMDFPSPEPVVQALRERVAHPIFGYAVAMPELSEVLCTHLWNKYDWEVTPEQIIYVPGVVASFKTVMRGFGQPGDNVLMQTPVYPPFLTAPGVSDQGANAAELVCLQNGNRLSYEIDFDIFEEAINEKTGVFLLCSPHNPVGRVWVRDELTRMAEICLRHNVLICSDEIHCDLIYQGHPHIPIAALSPEISKRTITLMAPSKTYNIPGMGFSFAIVQDEQVRDQFQQATAILPHVGAMGYTAALAAYRDGQPWLDAVLEYLQANRDYTTQFIDEHLPNVTTTHPEGTYLSWLDCCKYAVEDDGEMGQWIDPFFLRKAKVALNAGGIFGDNAAGFIRLNFACPHTILAEALERMRSAIEQAEGN